MSIDVSQFHAVFFEESAEGLDAMESELMALDPDNLDLEKINTIFRAAHSIKGGAGTFGFESVSIFTHDIETLLDQIRAEDRPLYKSDIDVFLHAVDCLRAIFVCLQDKTEPDMTQANELSEQFSAMLKTPNENNNGELSPNSDNLSQANTTEENGINGKIWKIYFKPDHDILKLGNEPLRLFSELEKLGHFSCLAVLDDLPEIEDFHADECYLAWHIELQSDCDKAAIDEVFEWVADEGTLSITCESLETDAISASVNDNLFADTTSSVNQESSVVEALQKVQQPIDTPLAEAAVKKTSTVENASIRVGIDKVDSLINMVGELVITQSMLGQLGEDFDLSKLTQLQEGLSQLEQNTRELQESVMKIRMLPISFAFSRFPRMVRDLSQKLDKNIQLILEGEQTELDKTVMEKIGDPLVHLVRNSIDHGIESPADRLAAGKPEQGTIKLNAFHQGGNILIEISDDGGGLSRERILHKAQEKGLLNDREQLSNDQIWQLIFHPGFSTAKEVSDVSGRGVGMDVVKRNIEALNGTVEIHSKEGEGSTVTICLPLTLAILDGQLVNIDDQIYIFPLVSIVESMQVDASKVNYVANGCDVLRLRDDYIPIVKLHEVFSIPAKRTTYDDGLLVVVEANGEKVGVLVDDLDAQQQIVIKSLEQNYKRIVGVSGATILGNGTVALILDVAGLIRLAGQQHSAVQKSFKNSIYSANAMGVLT